MKKTWGFANWYLDYAARLNGSSARTALGAIDAEPRTDRKRGSEFRLSIEGFPEPCLGRRQATSPRES